MVMLHYFVFALVLVRLLHTGMVGGGILCLLPTLVGVGVPYYAYLAQPVLVQLVFGYCDEKQGRSRLRGLGKKWIRNWTNNSYRSSVLYLQL